MVIFDQKSQDVLIGIGVLDQILVQTFAEDLRCGMLLFGILGKDRGARKAEYLQIPEKMDDIFVAIAEMAAESFIEDHDNLLVSQCLQMFVVIIFGDGTIQFLDGSDDNL